MIGSYSRTATNRLVSLISKRRYATKNPENGIPATDEGFGKGFFVSITSVLGVVALYNLDQNNAGDEGTLISRTISKYQSSSEVWEARNSVHTELIEQAATDRSLFQNSRTRRTIKLKFPEVFNNSSPWNQEAGWATGDITGVKAHMEAERAKYVPNVVT